MIFAWTGSGYSEVGSEYKGYYEQYLKSLENQIAAEPSTAGKAREAESSEEVKYQPTKVPVARTIESSSGHSDVSEVETLLPVPASSPSPTTTERSNHDCPRAQVAKTAGFLGVESNASMSYAITASESNDPEQRKLAAVILSFLGTREATTDLKGLANDTNPEVAVTAKDQLSPGRLPTEYCRQVTREPVVWSQ